MQTTRLAVNDPNVFTETVRILQSGGVVAFPTDTVYGLASSPFQAEAILKLFEAKGRDFNKAIAVLVGSVDQMPQIATTFTESAQRLTQHFWPGALTIIIPRQPSLPEIISPYPTIGVRMPNHPFALKLLQQTGPLATTSANISGGPNPKSAQDVLDQLDGRIDLVIDGGECPGGVPSSVVDCTSADIKILRQGAISEEDIRTIVA